MKRTLSIILALCLLVCLFAGCGGEKQNDPKPTQSGSSISEDAINQNDESLRDAEANNDNTIEKVTQLDSAPTNLDPTAMNNQGMNFLWEVYEMPYQLSGFGGDLVPVLADGSKGSFKPGLDHEDGSSEGYDAGYDSGTSDAAQSAAEAEKNTRVWVSKRLGSRYHSSPDCPLVIKPKEMTRQEAEDEGYTSCDWCW